MTRPAAARKVQLDGVTLNVEERGSGPAVLLLQGFPDSLRLWDGVVPRLAAAGYRAIAVDQRGFGESDAPAGRRHYGIDRLVADATGLLDALGIREPVRVVGHDWGAVVAWCLAMLRPQRVRSAVAISVGHPREYALAGLEQKRKGLYTIGWQFPLLAERWLTAGDWARMRHWLRHHPDPESCLRDLARPGRLTAGLNWYRANVLATTARTWPSCRVPVLGIWSSEDHCLAEDQMARSARRMAAPWRYERIDGAGHWLPLEQPERVASLALQWFEEVPGLS
jgi:pimeloyl-ACP methyl ester carboxylesterase